MEMKEAVKNVLKEIPSGCLFDTHTVINYLLKNNSDAYLSAHKNQNTDLYHGYISRVIQVIDELAGIEKVGDSWSKNIHDNFTKCACWKKI
ncbi:MAG: hypothetical protein LBV16_09215 [Elusimicrobiota bacterium]|jgi:prenyltransferase beta subunit|nr:hypothetical protein [Elusimicrobiota bacterium]